MIEYQGKKACPFCGEEILAVAIKCKHCGSSIHDAEKTSHEHSDEKNKTKKEEDDGNKIIVVSVMAAVVGILIAAFFSESPKKSIQREPISPTSQRPPAPSSSIETPALEDRGSPARDVIEIYKKNQARFYASEKNKKIEVYGVLGKISESSVLLQDGASFYVYVEVPGAVIRCSEVPLSVAIQMDRGQRIRLSGNVKDVTTLIRDILDLENCAFYKL